MLVIRVRPMKTQVRMIHAVRVIKPWIIETLLVCLQDGQIAGEKETEKIFW